MSSGQYHRRRNSIKENIKKHGTRLEERNEGPASTACIYIPPYRYRNPIYTKRREMREDGNVSLPENDAETTRPVRPIDPFLEMSSHRPNNNVAFRLARRRLENARWIECDVTRIQSMDLIMKGLTYGQTDRSQLVGSGYRSEQELYEQKIIQEFMRGHKTHKHRFDGYNQYKKDDNNPFDMNDPLKPKKYVDLNKALLNANGNEGSQDSQKHVTNRRISNVATALLESEENLEEGNTYTKYMASQKEFSSVFGSEEKFEPSVFDPPIDQRNRDIANRDDSADGVMWMGQSDDMDYICKMTLLCSELRFNLGGPYNGYKRLKGCRFFSPEIQQYSSNRAKILRYVDQDDITDYDEVYLKQKEIERRLREAYPPYPEHESLTTWGEVLVTSLWSDLASKGVSVQLYLCVNEPAESNYVPQTFRLKPKHVFMSGANFLVFICPKTSNLVFIERKESPTLPTNSSMFDDNVNRKSYLHRRFVYRRVSNVGNNGNTIEDNFNVKILKKCLSGQCSRNDHGGESSSHNLITCARKLGYNAYRFPLEELESVDRNPRSIKYALKKLPHQNDNEDSDARSHADFQDTTGCDTLIDYMTSINTKLPHIKEAHHNMKYFSTRCSILHLRSDSSFIGSYCFCLISMAAIMDELMEIFVLIHMQCHLTGANLKSRVLHEMTTEHVG